MDLNGQIVLLNHTAVYMILHTFIQCTVLLLIQSTVYDGQWMGSVSKAGANETKKKVEQRKDNELCVYP